MVDMQMPLFAALVFLIVSSPFVFKFTSQLSTRVANTPLADASGAPTKAGLIVHSLVVFAVTYAYLKTHKA